MFNTILRVIFLLSLLNSLANCQRIDEKILRLNCRHNPCKNAIRCEDRIDSYFCHCQETWFGLNCEERRDPLRIDGKRDNLNRMNYPNNNNQYGNSNYPNNNQYGNIMSCRNSPCKNGARCEDRSGTTTGYFCYCNDPWTGQNCDQSKSNLNNQYNNNPYGNNYPNSNPNNYPNNNNQYENNQYGNSNYLNNNQYGNIMSCRNSPCKNGARCEDRSGTATGYFCYCNDPWTGQNCDQSKSNQQNNIPYGNNNNNPYGNNGNQYGMNRPNNNNLHGNNYPNSYNPHANPNPNQPTIYYQPVSNPRAQPVNYGHGYGPNNNNNYPSNQNTYGTDYRDNRSFTLAIILGTIVPFIVISLVIIAIVCCCCRRKKRQQSGQIELPQRRGSTKAPLLNAKNQY